MSDSEERAGGTRRRTSLSEKQLAILDVIQRSKAARGYPPSMREIGDAVGLSSLSSVTHQLNQLELSGYLRRDPNRPRALEVLIDLPASEGSESGPAIADAAVRKQMDALGVELIGGTPDQFAVFLKARMDELKTVSKAANLVPQ